MCDDGVNYDMLVMIMATDWYNFNIHYPGVAKCVLIAATAKSQLATS